MDQYIITDARRQIRIMITVAISVFIFSVDFSMVNISLPTIAQYFRKSIGAAAFLPTGYMIVVTSSLLGFGKIGDLISYRRVFIAGLIVFTTGSFLCSLAPNMDALLALRMFQALGEAMMGPMGIAIITSFLPVRMRGLALGLVALAQGLGFAMGNVIGGFINAHFIWRGIFLLNIPIAAATILFALRAVPTEQKKSADKRFDWIGAALIFIALSALVYGLNLLGRIKNSPQAIMISFIIAAIGFIFFIAREKRADCPLLDFTLFRNRGFTYSNLAAFAAISVLMGCIFIVPFYLEMLRGLSSMQTGLYLMIAPLTMLFLAPIAGRLSDQIGSRLMCSTGALLEALALAVFSTLTLGSHMWVLAAALFTLGLAAGIFIAPNNKLVMSHAPEDRQGIASGVYKIGLSIGGVFGIAIFPIVIIQTIVTKFGSHDISLEQLRHSPEILQFGFHNMFISGIVIAAAAFVFSFLAKDRE